MFVSHVYIIFQITIPDRQSRARMTAQCWEHPGSLHLIALPFESVTFIHIVEDGLRAFQPKEKKGKETAHSFPSKSTTWKLNILLLFASLWSGNKTIFSCKKDWEMRPLKAPITIEGGGGGQWGREGDSNNKQWEERAAAVPHFHMPDSVLGTGDRKKELSVLPLTSSELPIQTQKSPCTFTSPETSSESCTLLMSSNYLLVPPGTNMWPALNWGLGNKCGYGFICPQEGPV